MMEDSKNRKMELAKVFKAIRDGGYVDKPQMESIQQAMLSPSDDPAAIVRAIEGLSQEDEFALMCRLMGTATHLVRLDQMPLLPGKPAVPDFLARFQPGCSRCGYGAQDSQGFACFVEVKSTTQRRCHFSADYMGRLRSFVDGFGLSLVLAVRFLGFSQNAVWVMVDDADRSKTCLNVSIDDWIGGVRHVLWDECFYMVMPGLRIQTVYDQVHRELGWGHPEYGTAKEFRIIDGDRVDSFDIKEGIMYSAFLEGFDLYPIEVQVARSETCETREPRLLLCSLADVIFRLSRLPNSPCAESGFSASTVLARCEEVLFDRDLVTAIADALMQHGYLGYVGIGNRETHVGAWCHYGGRTGQ